jgi:hypothetical protein
MDIVIDAEGACPMKSKALTPFFYLSSSAGSAFLFVQLRRLEARVISHDIQKGKMRLYG